MSALLPYLIPALFLLVIGIFFVGGILSVGALSQWLDRRRQMFFSLMLWMIAVGIAIPALTKKRILTEDDMQNMSMYLGGGEKVAMAGFWVGKILTWLFALLGASLLASHFLQVKPTRTSSQRSEIPLFLVLAIITYITFGGVTNALFGTKPDLDHAVIYPFLLFGVALTLPGDGFENTARTTRNVLLALCAVSLMMALVLPDQVLQRGHQGLIPGFDLRLWGAAPHANALGGIAMFYLLIERLVPWEHKGYRWLSWLVVVVTLILTQSKTNWIIAFILAGGLIAVEIRNAMGAGVKNPRHQQNVIVMLGGLIVGMIVVLISLIVIGPQTLVDSVSQDFESAGASTLTGRDVLWVLALKEWHANPLFGYGPKIWDEEYRLSVGLFFAHHAHNQYLDVLSRSGLFGLGGLISLIIAYFYYAIRYFTLSHGVLFAALVFILIRGFTETPLFIWSLFSQEMLINLTLVALIAQLSKSAMPDGLVHPKK